MEIIKGATEWAKAEMVSAILFMAFGLIYILVSVGAWKLGSTALTKSLIIPILVAGVLLLSAGIGFYTSNKKLLNNFEKEYNTDAAQLISKEIERTGSTIKTYENVALKVFPAIILVAVIVLFFVSNTTVRAIAIALIAFFSVLVLLDSQALKRMKTYHQQLKVEQIELKK